ncbi:kinase, putative [Ricinus communis]|uniref:Kinase, putative n=1 Tax=Ricinus communis TaxID=3988 RepID=B9RX61_RICCO|nr:kinase, putative [Ricinus communis]
MDCSPEKSYDFSSNPNNKLNINFSTVSRVYAIDPDTRERPKISACIFKKQVTYPFYVSVGPKFVRLYFKPVTYSGLNISKALFSVHVGQYTLLTTSSSTYSTFHPEAEYVVREFCINLEDQVLNMTFTPSSKILGAYAFVNKIEIVSMSSKLYIQEDVPLPLVGQSSYYSMENSVALEMMHRLNIGGNFIPPAEDNGMFRVWTGDDDDDFMNGEGNTSPIESEVEIKASSVKLYAAPIQVYTSATTIPDMSVSNYSATWSFPVDSGFYYLVRLHFCEISSVIQHDGQRVFHVYINNQTAEEHADIFYWSHGAGIPTYRDYIVNLSRRAEGIKYIQISLRSEKESTALPILNGLEIFKLSDLSHNLAGPHPFGVRIHPHLNLSDFQDHRVLMLSRTARYLSLSFFATSFLCSLHYLVSKSGLLRKTLKQEQSSDCCRTFSIAEIKAATDNFSDTLLIGTGGFGMVYKGSIDSGSTNVAIKRANTSSHQGLKEFQTEITVLSKLRHCHVVSLIGYSMNDKEMILVYNYMAQGTLRDHLYKAHKPPLPWKQRLKICLGAARGLHYLHTGAKNTIIHRDIKSTNILLDEKLVAKVSDFGLSTSALRQSNTHVSTIVKGTLGYLDPEYYRRQKLTAKSDVYSFGVVLFESQCARPAVMAMRDIEEEEYYEKVNLAEWALHCYQMGTLDQIIDPYLNGKIASECFKTFTDIARKCLAERGSERPSMGDVLCNLELALQQQNAADMEEDRAREEANGRTNDDVSIMIDGHEQCICFDHSDQTPGLEFSEIMFPIGR